jgi:hypothetical protein
LRQAVLTRSDAVVTGGRDNHGGSFGPDRK